MDLLSQDKLLSFQYYAEKHDVYHLLVHYLELILLEKPESPMDFLIDLLQRPLKPAIFFVTPPFPIREDLGSALAKTLQVPFISASQTLTDAVETMDPEALKAKQYLESGTLVPDNIINPLIVKKLNSVKFSGFVLQGYPSTRGQLNLLRKAGIYPHKIIVLDINDQLVLDSYYSVYADPTRGASYGSNVENLMKLLTARIQNYRVSSPLLLSAYSSSLQRTFTITDYIPYHLKGTVIGKSWFQELLRSGDEQSLLYAMKSWVYEKKPIKGPMSIRVALIPESISTELNEKVSAMARVLASRYGVVHVSKKSLGLSENASEEDVVTAIKKRVNEKDALDCGWILDDLVGSDSILKLLDEKGVFPNRIYYFTLSSKRKFPPKWQDQKTQDKDHAFYKSLKHQYGDSLVQEIPVVSFETNQAKSDLAIYESIQSHLMKSTVEIYL